LGNPTRAQREKSRFRVTDFSNGVVLEFGALAGKMRVPWQSARGRLRAVLVVPAIVATFPQLGFPQP
jgi:hypothetical protein